MVADWSEREHPRDREGKFSSGSSSSSIRKLEYDKPGQRAYETGYGSKPKPAEERYYGWSRPTYERHYADRQARIATCVDAIADLTRRADVLERADAEWEESKHPRGQPGNAGQFASSPGSSKKAEEPAKKSAGREPHPREHQVKLGESIKGYLTLVKQVVGGRKSTEGLVAEHGRQFFTDAGTYAGKKMQQQQCYKNAALMAITSPDKYTYVEGFVTVHGVPINHAWVVDKTTGSVVDPTIRGDTKNIGGYYGVPVDTDYLQKTLSKNKVYGVFGYHNRGIYDAPAGEYVARDAGGAKLPAGKAEKLPEAEAPATALFNNYRTPTVDDFMKSLPPHQREHCLRVESRLKDQVPTDAPVDKGGHRLPSGQFTEERQQLHTKIIRSILTPEKVKAARPPKGEAPTFTVLGGRAGSGKSFVTRPGGPVDPSKSIVIDSDMIKAQLPEYRGWNAAMTHEEASHIVEHAVAMAQRLKLNIVLDGTMKSFGPMRQRLEGFKSAGYKLEGYYVFAPPEVAARRAVGRSMKGEGRYVAPAYVLSSDSNERSFDSLREYFNKWEVYDSSKDKVPPTKVASGGTDG